MIEIHRESGNQGEVNASGAESPNSPAPTRTPLSTDQEEVRASALRSFDRSLPMELLKARETVMARFRPILRTYGLTEQQWRVLRALEGVTSISLSELSEATHLRLPSLSRITPGLVARGLVSRSTKAEDQRTSLITLARGGRQILDQVGPQSEKQYREIAENLGSDRLELLYELLKQVREST